MHRRAFLASLGLALGLGTLLKTRDPLDSAATHAANAAANAAVERAARTAATLASGEWAALRLADGTILTLSSSDVARMFEPVLTSDSTGS